MQTPRMIEDKIYAKVADALKNAKDCNDKNLRAAFTKAGMKRITASKEFMEFEPMSSSGWNADFGVICRTVNDRVELSFTFTVMNIKSYKEGRVTARLYGWQRKPIYKSLLDQKGRDIAEKLILGVKNNIGDIDLERINYNPHTCMEMVMDCGYELVRIEDGYFKFRDNSNGCVYVAEVEKGEDGKLYVEYTLMANRTRLCYAAGMIDEKDATQGERKYITA